MNGIDRNDQLTSYFRVSIRTRRPTRNFLFHMIQLVYVNSQIIYNLTRAGEEDKLSITELVRKLSLRLIQPFLDDQVKQSRSFSHGRTLIDNYVVVDSGYPCSPVMVQNAGDRRSCTECSIKNLDRRVKTRFFCRRHGMFLCPDYFENGKIVNHCWSLHVQRLKDIDN